MVYDDFYSGGRALKGSWERLLLNFTAKDTAANFKHVTGANDHRFGLCVFCIRSDIIRVTIKRREKLSKSQ